MARGPSRDRHNQLVEEIANEVDGKEDIHMLAVASQQINKWVLTYWNCLRTITMDEGERNYKTHTRRQIRSHLQ